MAPARPSILCLVGTRPEGIKMAPVILALRQAGFCNVTVLNTGQHRELARQALALFGLESELELEAMQPGQPLAALTARILAGLDPVLEARRPALLLVQGDTSSAFAGALAAFYRRIPVGHVEAGLRTGDLGAPFPEEFNRIATTLLGALHFAPTEGARANLLREGVAPEAVHVTGNPVIDALQAVAKRAPPCPLPSPGRRLVLVTAHRRENLGAPLRAICRALAELREGFPDVEFAFPVHPNPEIRGPVTASLGGLERIHLLPPLDYVALVGLLRQAALVLTDSGGLQEEAPALGKPVLVLRETTERPEAVAAGLARLVGTDTPRIVAETGRLLTDSAAYRAMAMGASPYGDGRAAPRIAELCRRMLLASQAAAPDRI